jgi:hypothetical protein
MEIINMRILSVLATLLAMATFVSGCASTKATFANDKTIVVDHEPGKLGEANALANKHCQKLGKNAVHLNTVAGSAARQTSTFECK